MDGEIQRTAEKLKILHVITSLRTGGAEKLMVDLLPRMRQYGHEVDLCVFDGVKTPFYLELQSKGIRIIDFGEGNSVYSPKNILRLRKLIRNYDIIHTHNTSPQFFAAMANIGIGHKLVTTEHNTHNRRRDWPGFSAVDRWMYNRYSKVICISDQAEINLKKFLGNCKTEITTIYNGVDVAKFANAKPSEELERIAPGRKKLIMVAAFRPQKDQDTLIKAMQLLPEEYHLFLVGEGPRVVECESLAKELNRSERVHFMGCRSDVAQLLKASDIVVMSSHYEGLSLSSVEGMSVGKPFIASDVDGLREVVKGYGVLFGHENAKELTEEIIKLNKSDELYQTIAVKCSRRAQKFSIEDMVVEYCNKYNKITNL